MNEPSLRELSPRAAEIVAVARQVLEAEGPDALTMRRIGDELSMKAPSASRHRNLRVVSAAPCCVTNSNAVRENSRARRSRSGLGRLVIAAHWVTRRR